MSGDKIVVSSYLVLRFQMRSGLPDVTRTELENIWEDAKYVGENRGGSGEKRLSTEYNILLVSQDGVVKTALVEDYHDEVDFITPCEWCGKPTETRDDCRKCDGWVIEQS